MNVKHKYKMRLLELITESISVSQHTSTVRSTIGPAILKIITTQYNKQPLANKDEVVRVESIYRNKFKDTLVDILSNLTKQFTKNEVNVEFRNIGEGTGAYLEDENTIVIHNSIISSLVRAALVFHKSKQDNTLNDKTLQFVNGTKDQAILSLTNIFLHELTHAIQVQSGGRFEYKHGYVEPNTKKFFTAMAADKYDPEQVKKDAQKLYSDPKDIEQYIKDKEDEAKRNKDIYFSQPDEISAYAQQRAVELINTIYKKTPQEQIAVVNALLKDIASQSSKHQYSDFGKNVDPKYKKVYKRYLKLVYQELSKYKDILNRHI